MKSILMAAMILFSLILTACNRPIPKPGAIYISQDKEAAKSDLVGYTVAFNVKQATGALARFKNCELRAKFLLDYVYVMHQAGQHEPFSHGDYLYSTNTFSLNKAALVMQGDKGLTVDMQFLNRNVGSFKARSTQVKYPGSMSGVFSMKRVTT